MIVSRGIGRSITGASGIIVAAGLGLVVATVQPQPPNEPLRGVAGPQLSLQPRLLGMRDDRDLLDILPIIVEVINGRR